MKKLINEFKTFITRGNVMDLAVGVIIGSAFTAIVNALSNNVLRPLINWLLAVITGGESLSEEYTFLKKAYVVVDGVATNEIDLANSIFIDWGAFINAIINFFLIAVVLFAIVKVFNKLNSDIERATGEAKTMTLKERKQLRKEGKTLKEIEQIEKQRYAEYLKAQEQPAPKTSEELLQEIVDTLKKAE